MADSKLIFVTGATGKQGGAVARALLAQGHRVRGMTRNVNSTGVKSLAGLGAKMVAGDFKDPESLVAAATGVDAMFAMSTPFEAGEQAEIREGIALVDAAVAAGVDHFVCASIASANKIRGFPTSTASSRLRSIWPRVAWPGRCRRPCTSWTTF